MVTGPAVAQAFGQKLLKISDIFSIDNTADDGTSIFMSVGNTIHQLSCLQGAEVEVNILVRKPTEPAQQGDATPSLYKPAIRTLFETSYRTRTIDIITPKPERNWNYIDSYLAGHDDEMTEHLRFWRARFVLIPVASRNTRFLGRAIAKRRYAWKASEARPAVAEAPLPLPVRAPVPKLGVTEEEGVKPAGCCVQDRGPLPCDCCRT